MRRTPSDWKYSYWEMESEGRTTVLGSEASLSYHCSWGWLMPIIEKISAIKIGDGVEYVEYAYPRTFGMINEETKHVMVRLNGFPCFSADTLIEAAYLAVVDFIERYNLDNTNVKATEIIKMN